MNNKIGKDLTKEPPRSPKAIIGGFAILGRTIDKCRAKLWGNVGEYHFDCPLDNQLFSFKGFNGKDFQKYVAAGHTDEEIALWVKNHGTPKTDGEINQWSAEQIANHYSQDPDKKAWLEGENARLSLPKNGTLFDYLDADDVKSFTV